MFSFDIFLNFFCNKFNLSWPIRYTMQFFSFYCRTSEKSGRIWEWNRKLRRRVKLLRRWFSAVEEERKMSRGDESLNSIKLLVITFCAASSVVQFDSAQFRNPLESQSISSNSSRNTLEIDSEAHCITLSEKKLNHVSSYSWCYLCAQYLHKGRLHDVITWH